MICVAAQPARDVHLFWLLGRPRPTLVKRLREMVTRGPDKLWFAVVLVGGRRRWVTFLAILAVSLAVASWIAAGWYLWAAQHASLDRRR